MRAWRRLEVLLSLNRIEGRRKLDSRSLFPILMGGERSRSTNPQSLYFPVFHLASPLF
ncbi:hypothetical protein M407DRAFT_246323 [Tulasnella calospora MUT 4182]|uniref:Uncharacterized protein n=1 Tax=Tulasnella calospora MUT 4182 TaxID=1051891 RepID=A0A0C3KC33_9AGAM|nr:hypothetical protein M407DRAFT_246323 [Tulasnella calospora MUT 4182]